MRRQCRTVMTAALLVPAGGLGDGLAAQIGTFTANKGANKVKIQTNAFPSSTNSQTFTTLTSTTLSIPAGQTGRFVIRFSGESTCNGGNAGNRCELVIFVDGEQDNVNPIDQHTFDTDDTGDNYPEAHALERVSNVLGAGSHTIEIKWAVLNLMGGGNPTFTLDDWVFTIELWRVS